MPKVYQVIYLKGKLQILSDAAYFIIGVTLYSLAVNVFIVPAEILPGGITGISAAVTHYINIGTGTLFLVLNLPIIYIGYRKMGLSLIVKTAVVTVILSVGLDISKAFLKPFSGDRMLSALAGGVLLGGGIALIMLRGATTGGTDIIAKLVNDRFPSLTVGRVILISDIAVISLSAIVFRDLTSLLYSVVSMYASARVTDLVLYGSGGGKAVYAITLKGSGVCSGISKSLNRGATKISVTGGYTGDKKDMVFCVCRRDEINRVLKVIKSEDPDAFVTVCDAGDIIGEGFNR